MGVDVAVIGGGIIGCSAAALLAERGAKVVLFESTAVGAGASGRNLGALQHPFDPVLGHLFHDSLDRYRRLAEEGVGFTLPPAPAGLLLINADARAAREQAERLRTAVPELEPQFLDAVAVAEAEPSLAPGFAACRLATGYPIPPSSATSAWASLAERHGAELRVGVAAGPWVDDGALRGVRLADGSTRPAGRVLVASGPWSPLVVDPTGAWEPVRRTWGVTVQVNLGPAAPRHIVEQDEVDAANRPAAAEAVAAGVNRDADPPSLFSIASADGISTLGSTFLPAEPDADRVAALLVRRGRHYLPALEGAPVVGIRRCARPQSIDGRPFIGEVGRAELFVCAGHGPWGISTGPASAAMAVDAILDGKLPPPALRADRAIA